MIDDCGESSAVGASGGDPGVKDGAVDPNGDASDVFARNDYVNPEFFTPKEIATLAMTLTLQVLAFIVRRGKLSRSDIKIAQDWAALIILLSIDDGAQQQLFARATKIADLDRDVLLESRRRLAEAMGAR